MSQTKQEEIKAQVTSILKEVEANPLQLRIVIQRLCEENASLKDQLAITKQKPTEIKDPEKRRRATEELWKALWIEDDRAVEAAVEAGADVRARDVWGFTPLHNAVRRGREAAVLYLLSHGAELEAKSDYGFTPLNLAASFGRLSCTKLLVERGADPNARDRYGYTPLAITVQNNYRTVQQYLRSVGGTR